MNRLIRYVLDELNAWSAELTTDLDAWCTLSALPNLKLIAKKLGARIKPATEAIKALDSGRLREYLKTGALRLDLADGAVDLGVDELIVKTEFAATQGDIYAAQTTSDGATTVAIDSRQDDALRSSAIARDLCNRVNKLRKKAKLVVGEPIDVYYVDDDSAGLATAGAILANASVMDKANIVAMPLDAAATAAAIAFDVLPTPYGSDALRVVLCKPFPALSVAAKAKAGAQAAVLASLVSSLAPASLDRPVSGTLDGVAFNLTVGTDIFHSATLAYKAQ
jgi:hypothetical protein